MSSFGVSEALIIGGVMLINSGRVTEGFIAMGLGTFSGFARYTTWFGIQNKKSLD